MTTATLKWLSNSALVALLATAGACGNEPVAPGDTIHLSAQQATAISNRMQQIATLGGELGWLSDSANLVIAAGVEVERIVLSIDGTEALYYAVGLHREFPGSTTSFATFHVLFFDNPNDPRNFVIANGYVLGTGSTPPASVAAAFDRISVFAHLIEFAGGVLTDWPATVGSASFASSVTSEACTGISLPPSTTCARSSITVGFSIAEAGPPAQPLTSSRVAALPPVAVPAITLRLIFR